MMAIVLYILLQINLLSNDNFDVREKAQQTLTKLKYIAYPFLYLSTFSNNLETRKRSEAFFPKNPIPDLLVLIYAHYLFYGDFTMNPVLDKQMRKYPLFLRKGIATKAYEWGLVNYEQVYDPYNIGSLIVRCRDRVKEQRGK